MLNVFISTKEINEIYDLKGSTLGRSNPNGSVKKDLDWKKKIALPKDIKDELLKQIENDAMFLQQSSICDYSLLIGIHHASDDPDQSELHNDVFSESENQTQQMNASVELSKRAPKRVPFYTTEDGGTRILDENGQKGNDIIFFGIIDYLTDYGLNKKLERFFKSVATDANQLSVAPPDQYAKRFCEFMKTLFL
eukprot:TRINITY_DN3748_c0_g1_i2.p1 TRINITY_DN3748_c0_g1~~TRINITY_DN3748_c0_g1_i2.p1  ORF type:complete len:194 (+),score=27.44 TRINITY_DN3748_c0_g1_i2:454-1035(+)